MRLSFFQLSVQSKEPFIIGMVNCTGLENSLAECNYTAPGEYTGCVYNNHEAGVLCYNGTGRYFV